MLSWIKSNLSVCECLLDSADLNILTVKKHLLNIVEIQTYNATDAQDLKKMKGKQLRESE